MAKSQALIETLSRLIAKQPFFAVYLMDQMKVEETNGTPTAATDGRTIYINPEWFGPLTIEQRVFVMAHEVMHGIYQHMARGKGYKDRGFGSDLKPWNHNKFNRAADYIINATLTEAKVGEMPVGGLYHPKWSSADLADDVYLQLPDEDGDEGQGSGPGHGGFDEHMDPKDPSSMPSDAEVKRAIASAKNAAKAMGNLPGVLERLIDGIMDPKVRWEDYLRDLMTSTSGRDTQTWAKPNRRKLATTPHIYMPGATGFQTGGVAVVVDTSGSISDEMVHRFLSEVSGILSECRPEWLKVLWTDTHVAGVDDVDDPELLTGLKAKGGGGTDMPAAFRYLDEHGIVPEHVVVLTDGYTPWDEGNPPGYPVIWGITTDVTAPYGTTVHVEV